MDYTFYTLRVIYTFLRVNCLIPVPNLLPFMFYLLIILPYFQFSLYLSLCDRHRQCTRARWQGADNLKFFFVIFIFIFLIVCFSGSIFSLSSFQFSLYLSLCNRQRQCARAQQGQIISFIMFYLLIILPLTNFLSIYLCVIGKGNAPGRAGSRGR